jgi:hypothetical protein
LVIDFNFALLDHFVKTPRWFLSGSPLSHFYQQFMSADHATFGALMLCIPFFLRLGKAQIRQQTHRNVTAAAKNAQKYRSACLFSIADFVGPSSLSSQSFSANA